MQISKILKHGVMPLALVSMLGCEDTDQQFTVDILSSQSDQISGGDARIQITYPDSTSHSDVQVKLNGEVIEPVTIVDSDSRTITGVISGMSIGSNELSVTSEEGNIADSTLELINHPIEGPIFSGPHQSPFYCNDTDLAAIGLVNADENCMTETVVSYKYLTTEGLWVDYTLGMERPDDMSTTVTNTGIESDLVVRYERGTINRFMYTIAVLAGQDESLEIPDLNNWNKKLLFYFRGGTAIGHQQGLFSERRSLYTDGLKRGYAVIFSSGTATKTHYNLQLAGETALMLKERFITAYDVPEYTIAVGASGGAVQQYMFSQNIPSLLQGLIPYMSYPDMITQAAPATDCSLIGRWIDNKLMENPESHWSDWTQRTLLDGFNASNDISNPIYEYGLMPPGVPNGAGECSENWYHLSPLVFNPLFGTVDGVSDEDQANTEWTHFADAINIYGKADDGYANRTWDNVGVQYGLSSLKAGAITPEEFLDLNFNVGTLKQEKDMIQEGCPFIIDLCFQVDPSQSIWPDQVDPWGARNFLLSDGTNPAPRAKADPDAVKNAIEGGLVNYGDIQVPTIDVRINREAFLDMHNTHQSFVTRQRMLDFDGDASNQVIWFEAPTENEEYSDPLPMALDVMDSWLTNMAVNPTKSLHENKPSLAVDLCLDSDTNVVASGDDVWDGVLDTSLSKGACAKIHDIYSDPRMVAGGPYSSDVFSCELQPVDSAIVSGIYGDWLPTPDEVLKLKAIYPEGVCKF